MFYWKYWHIVYQIADYQQHLQAYQYVQTFLITVDVFPYNLHD